VPLYGVNHTRHVALLSNGNELAGADELMPAAGGRQPADVPFALRFHLHPHVRASLVREGESVLLLLPNRRAWKFTAPGYRARIEDSLYLGGADGARRSTQIAVYGSLAQTPQIRWHFMRYEGSVGENSEPEERAPALPL
jgi:uncharacterized heparinase superfamily protein